MPGFNTGIFTSGSLIITSIFFVVAIIFILAICFLMFIAVKGFFSWSSNNSSPIHNLTCKVVAKRMQVSGGSGDSSANTSYYATFEFENRQRLELRVGRDQFGYIVEGDQGILTYQGSRFKGFSRQLAFQG